MAQLRSSSLQIYAQPDSTGPGKWGQGALPLRSLPLQAGRGDLRQAFWLLCGCSLTCKKGRIIHPQKGLWSYGVAAM